MSEWLTPYFFFNGNCEEAVKFYQKVFGGETTIMHFGEAPPNPDFPVPDHVKNLVLHAELKKNGHVIRFSDTFPGNPFSIGNNVSFAIECETKEETKAMFAALSAGGIIDMELQETFFSPLYGSITDKYGIGWQIVCKPL